MNDYNSLALLAFSLSVPKQVGDWKKDHKAMCSQLREMREGKAGGVREPLDRQGVVARVLGKVRLYLCPFAVCHGETQGRGFVFVQVKETMASLVLVLTMTHNRVLLRR